MKKLISLFLFLTVQVGLFAQEYYPEGTRWTEKEEITHQPLPFLEGNPIWVCKSEHIPTPDGSYWFDAGDRSFSYYFLGKQKEIDGKVYTMMGEIISRGEDELTVNRWLPVREENGIVYAITDSLPGFDEENYVCSYFVESNPVPYLQQGNECVLYNFNTKMGETIYPHNEELFTVDNYGTYQLMDGTACRVLETELGFFDLCEKLGFLYASSLDFGIMDPLLKRPVIPNGEVASSILNAYYQDNVMLYKALDNQDVLCESDTFWTHEDACLYALSYKADPCQEEVFSYIRQLQLPEDGDVAINETTFPDENFRNWVLAQSYGADGVLTEEEIAGVTRINVNNKRSIQSLKGIEHFTALTTLDCVLNQLTELDLSKNTLLTTLNCYCNQLTALDLSNNTALEHLECWENQLSSLNVSMNTALTYLDCHFNQLTALDISKNIAIIELYCNYNQLTSLDVSQNTALTKLDCVDNQLTSLDVSQNTALEKLKCAENLLTSLNVSACTMLRSLICRDNRLETLEVLGCSELEEVSCYSNRIKGEAMDCLIAGLPVIPGGWGHLPIMSTENEQNVMTKSQVAAAKAKGWNPRYKYGTFDYTYGWLDYEGCDEPIEPVTYTTGQMATIILPTEPDASKGKYYRLDRCEKGQIIFEQELQPQARVPYIIVPDEDFSIDPITLDLTGLSRDTVAIEGISFIGSYVRTELPASTGGEGSSSYIDIIDTTPDCGLLPSEETGKEAFLIGALRAYLDVDWTKVHWDDPYSQTDPKGVRNKLEIVLLDYGTGIDEIQNSNFKIQNGEGSTIYDLSGRRVNNSKFKIQSSKPQRGIYIENGKKILHSTHP